MGNYSEEYYEIRRQARNSVIISVTIIAVILVFLFLLGSTFVSTFKDLGRLQDEVNTKRVNVENAMQYRLDLIPSLVESVKGYYDGDESIYNDIEVASNSLTTGINSRNVQLMDEANSLLGSRINMLVTESENYPNLFYEENYANLMIQLEDSSNQIAFARGEYNVIAQEYNERIRRFPGSVVANIFKFKEVKIYSTYEIMS